MWIRDRFTNPQTLGDEVPIALPEKFLINDNMVVAPAPESEMDQIEILRGDVYKRQD